MTAIFISHSSADNEAAVNMKRWLEAQGHTSLFLDFDPEAGIKVGSGWEQTLYQKLRQCQAVIALLTPNWLASKWCFAELVQAREHGKAIFPVMVLPCDASGIFSDIQHIDLTAESEEGYQRLRIGLLERGLDPLDVFDWDPSRPPYPGLLAFQEADAAIFFGRGEDILKTIETLDALRRQGNEAARFALLLGASGSGKSSLARAGIIPRLKKKPAEWLPVPPFRPQLEPLDELAMSLATMFETHGRPRDWSALRTELHDAAQSPVGAQIFLKLMRDLAIAARQPEATVLLTIDQAEELFGYTPAEATTRFLRLLRAGLEIGDQRLMALATLRSDFLGEFQNHPALQDSEYPHHFRYRDVLVNPMPLKSFPEIIQGPARLAGLQLDDGLVEAMVNDTGTRDALPLLAFTLRRLYERFGGDGRLSLEEYQSLGQLEGAVREEAERIIIESNPIVDELDALRAAFVPTMVRINAEGGYARRRALFDDLPRRALPLLRRFVDARLLVTDRDAKGRETIEVAHEALLRTWPQLTIWLSEDQDKLRLLESLQRASMDWDQSGRRDDLLIHHNIRLKDTEALVSNPRFVLPETSIEHAYMSACNAAQQAHEAAEKEEKERRIRDAERITAKQRTIIRLVVIGLIVVFLAATTTGWQWFKADRAQQEARIATIIRQVIQAKKEFEISPTRGLLLAVEALKLSRDEQLPCVAQFTCVQFTAQTLADLLSRTGGIPLIGHKGQVVALSFSDDGKLLATADDSEVYLWRVDQLKIPFGKLRSPSQIRAVSLSGDSKLLATAGYGVVHLWRMDRLESPFHSFSPGALENMGPTSASFSPNAELIVTVSGAGMARVWRLQQFESPKHIADLTNQSGPIIAASFTPDGKFIATASYAGLIQQWSLDQLGYDPKPLQQADLKTHIEVATFSLDGKNLLIPRQLKTENLQSTAHIVNFDRPETWEDKPPTDLTFKSALGAATFSADGKLIAIGDDRGTVRIWRTDSPSSPHTELRGHEGLVYDASFSSDGNFIATAGSDRTARIWQVDQPSTITNHDQSLNWTTRLDTLINLARATAGRNFTREEWLEFFPEEEYQATFTDLLDSNEILQTAITQPLSNANKTSSIEPDRIPTEATAIHSNQAETQSVNSGSQTSRQHENDAKPMEVDDVTSDASVSQSSVSPVRLPSRKPIPPASIR